MDYKTFIHIKSLIIKLKKLDQKHDFRMAFLKMSKALNEKGTKEKLSEPTGIRRYCGLFQLKEWWHLLFRTHNGRGAYLFLRLIKDDNILEERTTERKLWKLVTDCSKCTQAENDSESDVDEEPQGNQAVNEKGPGISEDGI